MYHFDWIPIMSDRHWKMFYNNEYMGEIWKCSDCSMWHYRIGFDTPNSCSSIREARLDLFYRVTYKLEGILWSESFK